MSLGEFNGKVAGVYHLNGNGNDSSGNGCNLTAVNSPTYPAGKYNQGAGLVKASQQGYYAQTGTTAMGLGRKHTISVWINASSLPNTSSYPETNFHSIAQQYNNLSGVVYTGLNYQMPNGGSTATIRFEMYVVQSDFSSVFYTYVIGLNTWYHICGVCADTYHNLFLNGKQVGGPVNTTGGNNGWNTAPFSTIGMVYPPSITSRYWWNGIIDEAIWDTAAWSTAQVRNYYNQAVGRYAPKARF
jgi:hypothetical protein